MGTYLKKVEAEELPLPSNPEFFVRMKKKASYGDEEAAKGSMIRFTVQEAGQGTLGNGNAPTAAQVLTETEISAYNTVLISRLVIDWNLTDSEGNLLPIKPETVQLLDPEDGRFLAEEAIKRLGRREEKDKVPFEKPSGQP